MTVKPIDEKAVFNIARQIDSSEARAAYLQQVGGNQPEALARVLALLEIHEQQQSFLEMPVGTVSPTLDRPLTEQPGTQIGPYKLLQEIGEGGMGVVYMAEQHTPVKRRVALKLIKPGMDTRQVIARFEAERQALAMMDHPNIAKVLDCGTTETGRPYFVMELVKGIPITRYCDENHLTPRERLALFVDVCHAIQHAHQKGIIHRDVKPSNILVAEYDQKPVPKIIDFGVAKALNSQLTDKTMFTQLGQIVGTIEYMSPEQSRVNQMDVDTRSDIYSLGVLLYELLTGATPFDKTRMRSAAFEELMRIIREEDPPRPSTRLSTIDKLPSIAANRKTEPKKLSLLLRGELDWIVMKAMEKDRGRRYETAAGFAADVQRYLSDETVAACPPSAGYRFQKFARRNKLAIVTASLIAAALVVGLIGTSWQAIRATRAEGVATTRLHSETKARKEAEDARMSEQNQRAIAEEKRKLADLAREEAENLRVKEQAQRKRATASVHMAINVLESLYIDQILERKALRYENAERSDSIHQVFSQLTKEELDLMTLFGTFLDSFIELNKNDDAVSPDVARAFHLLGIVSLTLGKYAVSERCHQEAKQRIEKIAREMPDDVAVQRANATILSRISNSPETISALVQASRLDPGNLKLVLLRAQTYQSAGQFEQASNIFLEIYHNSNADAECMRHCGNFWVNAPAPFRDLALAEQAMIKAVAKAPFDPEIRCSYASFLFDQLKNVDEANRVLDEAAELNQNYYLPYLMRAHWDRGNQNLEDALANANKAVQRFPVWLANLEIRTRINVERGNYHDALRDVTNALQIRPEDAHTILSWIDPAIVSARGTADDKKLVLDFLNDLVSLDPKNREIYRSHGDHSAILNQSDLAIRNDSGTAEPRNELKKVACFHRGVLYYELGEIEKATADFHQAIALGTNDFAVYRIRGDCYANLKQFQVAVDDYTKAIEIASLPWETSQALQHRSRAQFELSKFPETLVDIAKALDANPENVWAVSHLGLDRAAQCPDADFKKAYLALASRAIEIGGTNKKFAYHHRGILYRAMGDVEKAVADFNRAIELEPAFVDPYTELAETHRRAGKYEQALAFANKAIELNPTYAEALRLRGHSFCQLGETEKALADYRRAEELEPKNTRHTLARLAALAASGQAEASQTELNQLFQHSADPGRLLVDYGLELIRAGWLEQMESAVMRAAEFGTSVESIMHYNLGCGYALTGDKDRAFAALNRSIELGENRDKMVMGDLDLIGLRDDPRFAQVLAQLKWGEWFQTGRAKYEAGKFAEAIEDLTKAAELNPNHGLLWHVRGRAYRANGQTAEADADFERYLAEFNLALAVQPGDWNVLNRRGVALSNLRRWDEALADFSQAMELAPDKPALHRNRATCFLEKRRWGDAADDLARVIELSKADWQTHYHRALARLGADDIEGYRAACREMVAAFADTKDPLTANFVAWTCSLAPDALTDWSGPIALARRSCEAEPTSSQNQNTLGTLLVRAGQTDEAIRILTAVAEQLEKPDASSNTSPAYTWYALALAHATAGQAEPARRWYDKANAWTAKLLDEPATATADPVPWNRRLTLEMLRKESNSKFETDTQSQGVRAN